MAIIQIHYEIQLVDGTLVDSSRAYGEPVTIDTDIPPFPLAIADQIRSLQVGQDPLTITLKCEQAYGQREDELIFEVEKSKLPENFDAKLGAVLSFGVDGDELIVTVLDIEEDKIKLDGNHPLAGLDLTFIIERIQ